MTVKAHDNGVRVCSAETCEECRSNLSKQRGDVMQMSDAVDYISHIDAAAADMAGDHQSIEKMILASWAEVEQLAEAVQHDILLPSAALRQAMLDLGRILYAVSDANVQKDCAQLREKDRDYGGSWCRRGGRGAFFTIVRKADRFIEMMRKYGTIEYCMKKEDGGQEHIKDTIGDWRRYLILVEAHIRARHAMPAPPALADIAAAQHFAGVQGDDDIPF